MAEGVTVPVLEARGTIGGRMCSKEIYSPGGKKAVIDLGGQWIGTTQTEIVDLVRELGITKFKQYKKGDTVVAYGGAPPVRVTNDPPAPDEAGHTAAEALSTALDEAAKDINTEMPWMSPRAQDIDKRTLGQWIDDVGKFNAYARFWVGLDAKFNQSGGSPYEVSLLHSLFEQKANPSAERPDEFLLVGGAGQIPELMCTQFGIKCKPNARVETIQQDAKKVLVTTREEQIEADAAIVAMPPLLAGAIRYDPPPSAQRIQLTSRMAMGTIAKVAFIYDEPWWRGRGFSGACVSSDRVVGTTADSGLANDVAKDPPGILTSFIQGDEFITWSQLDEENRKKRAYEALEHYFKLGVDAPPWTYDEKIWPQEQFTCGAYNGYLPPGGWTSYGPAIRAPHGRIFWAGTETATKWMGYFDGAIRAGYQAADDAVKLMLQG
jgi:monoamine oxidase